jgi:hypothetical protein
MDIYNRKFVASSNIFSGFTTEINIVFISSINDLCKQFKENLKEILQTHHLEVLLKKLEECKFHIHSHTIEDILTSKKNDIFYICEH